ncbi:MAG: transposase [Microcoleus sp. SU_5_3]|nr:transposase [Microcoleus sp. SU_5_3]
MIGAINAGDRRITAELNRQGQRVNYKRIHRLMLELGIVDKPPRKRTTMKCLLRRL